MASRYEHVITKFAKCQAEKGKDPRINNLPHPSLMCDIDPDVRPFTWPRRKKGPAPKVEQLELWDNLEDNNDE